MEKDNIIEMQNKESVSDALTEMLQNGARELICNYKDIKLLDPIFDYILMPL